MIMVIGGRCQGKSSFAKEHFENRVQEKGKTQETCLEDHQKDPKADHWADGEISTWEEFLTSTWCRNFHLLVRRILNAITVDRFHLSLTVAGGDAAETALLHAAACSIVFPALSSVQYVLKIRRREVRIQPDFVNGENQASFDIRLRSCPARILWAGLRFLVAYIGNTIREREQEAQTEPPRPKAPAAK